MERSGSDAKTLAGRNFVRLACRGSAAVRGWMSSQRAIARIHLWIRSVAQAARAFFFWFLYCGRRYGNLRYISAEVLENDDEEHVP